MSVLPSGIQTAQITVPAAQARLAELAVGQLYRVQITQVFPGKVEVLLGRQYLLAATPLKFTAGDMVTLKLVARAPDLLTFQLMLPPAGASSALEADLATLLRAANLPDTAQNRALVELLVRNEVPLTLRSTSELYQLMQTLPREAVAAFLPLYRELLARNLRPELAVMEQLAQLSKGTAGLSGLLAGAMARMQEQRGRGRRRALEDAVEAALTTLEREDDLPTASVLRDRLRLLYGSPEKALHELLLSLGTEEGEEEAEPDNQVQPATREPASTQLELDDLTNLALNEELPGFLAIALNMLQAIRLSSALAPGAMQFALPAVIDGEPTEIDVSINVIAEQYYQKDYLMRVRLDNATQGAVEFQLRTRGPGLQIDIHADREETVAAYSAQLDRFRKELASDGGFLIKRLEIGRQSL